VKVAALIADDEPVARAGLRSMLAGVAWLACIGEAASGPAAVEAIDRLRPDVVFLDIQMPGLLGTEVLGRVRHQPLIVFTTAYAQHAVTAFELGALDYLLKPFGMERLSRALERVRAASGSAAHPDTGAPPALDRLREVTESGPLQRLFVRSGGAILPVPVSGIAWFEAAGDYVIAHAGRARHVLDLPLHRLEARLDPGRFVRIHRSRILQLDHVTAFRRLPGGQLVAELDDGARLAVSRNRARGLRGLAV
jgi:two-component system, LytTR family, response regulator